MVQPTRFEKSITVSAKNQEPVEIHLESTRPVAIRLDVQGNTCTCSSARPGSYVDMEPAPSRH